MRTFLGMTKEEWQEKYEFLGFKDYCPECGKEADSKEKYDHQLATCYMCDDCKLMWDAR